MNSTVMFFNNYRDAKILSSKKVTRPQIVSFNTYLQAVYFAILTEN